MADSFAGFVDNGPAASPQPPTATLARTAEGLPYYSPDAQPQRGADPFARFTDEGPGSKPRMDVSTSRAALEGFLDTAGFGFRDEIKGLSEASGLPSWMGGFRAPVGAARLGVEKLRGVDGENEGGVSGIATGDQRGPVEKSYERARDETRDVQHQAEEQHPYTYIAGQVGGAAVAPGMVGGKLAATVGGRALRAGKVGAVSGGLYGVGSGESTEDRAIRGAVGAGLGGTIAAAASPVVDLAAAGLSKAGSAAKSVYQTLRSEIDPGQYGKNLIEDEAAKRIVASQATDLTAQGPAWKAEEIAAAKSAGVPLSIADAGGERTLALARSAANQSPEARGALTETANDRFAGQSQRAAGLLRGITGGQMVTRSPAAEPQSSRFGRIIRTVAGNVDATSEISQLNAAARRANRPAYVAAYEAGDRPIWSPELERLTAAPTVQQALRTAVNKWRDWQVHDGFGAANPPVQVNVAQGGLLQFTGGRSGMPVYPNIQFWDYAARNIADKAQAARNAGKNHLAEQYGGLERALKAELDRLVPQYQEARQGAARFFGARDALEAGRMFSRSNADIGEARQALAGMSPPERELFARGYASDLADQLERAKDSGSTLEHPTFTSAAGRQKMQLALGDARVQRMEQAIAPDRRYHYFDGASDALAAGRNFVNMKGDNAAHAPTLTRFDPQERELFARGFASELADRVLELRDNQDIIKQAFLSSPAAKQRIAMALGPNRARQLEVYLRAESIADRLRTALGNSTTARQLAEMGLAGAGGLALGHGAVEGELDTKHILGAALLFGSAYGKHRMQIIENSVARRIGEMLASDNPTILQRGLQIVAKNDRLLGALRTAGEKIESVIAGKATPRAILGKVQGASSVPAEPQQKN